MKTLITIYFSFVFVTLFAQEKIFEREYTYRASDLDSKISSRTIALNQVRSMLLNEIGVYVESESILKTSDVSGEFSQDFIENISTLSAGVTKLQVLAETWNGETFWLKASITVDRKSLEESLKQLVNDRQKVKEMETLKLQLKTATEELNNLRKRIVDETKQGDESTNKELNRLYNTEIGTLDAGTFVLNGYEKFYQGNYRGAMTDFDKAIEIDPRNARAYIGRAFTKYKLHDFSGEIEDYNKAIDLDPSNSNTYYNRGVAKDALQDYKGVIDDCSKAIGLDPKYAMAYYNRGVAKARLNDDRGAIVDYTRAIEIDPNLAEPYSNRGNAKARLGDERGAMDDFNKAIKLEPIYIDAYNNRGILKINRKDYKGAIADFNRTIEIDQRNAAAYYNRGVAKYNLGQKRSACLDFGKAGELGDSGAYDLIRQYCN